MQPDTCNTDDRITYRHAVSRQLTRREVKVSTEVELLVPAQEADQQTLGERARQALQRFLPASWNIISIKRAGESTGYERITYSAACRIPVDQAYNLAARARAAAEKGLSLSEPQLDYSLPASAVATAVGELRKATIVNVLQHIREYDEWTGRSWRIGEIRFGLYGGSGSRTVKGAYRSEEILEDDVASEERGSSERIQLVAEVTLRARTGAG